MPRYQIRIQGHLGPEWSEWFDGMILTCQDDGFTILSGDLTDQAALYGVLVKIRDLGLPLISLHEIERLDIK